MKHLKYLSIQSRFAPAYWFRHHDAQNFRSVVECITLSQTLLISSIYRTDLFFLTDNEDDISTVIKAWCAFKGLKYDKSSHEKFIRGLDRPKSLEFYFDTLFHLMHQPTHLARYKDRFREVAQIEPSNYILQDLMACDLHLSKQFKKEELAHVSLSEKPLSGTVFLPCKHFSLIADKGIAEMIYN